MGRRERLERKLEKRAEWAEKRDSKAAAAFTGARAEIAGIPPGQPVLVGHYSEKRHRAALRRHDGRMRAGIESEQMASHHRSKAAGLEAQLDNSIFSDDADATQQLGARIAEREELRTSLKKLNAAWRKAKRPKPDDAEGWGKVAEILKCDIGNLAKRRELLIRFPYYESPVPRYELSNLGGNIKRDRDRLANIKIRQQLQQKAEESGGVFVERWKEHNHCRVTFEEKPAREVLTALKEAGYSWGSGSWSGQLDRLPDCVTA